MQHLAEVSLQILFYATPIIYPTDMLRKKVGVDADINPLAAVSTSSANRCCTRESPLGKPSAWPGVLVLAVTTLATTMLVRLQHKIIFQL